MHMYVISDRVHTGSEHLCVANRQINRSININIVLLHQLQTLSHMFVSICAHLLNSSNSSAAYYKLPGNTR